jgi:hypothetical protein
MRSAVLAGTLVLAAMSAKVGLMGPSSSALDVHSETTKPSPPHAGHVSIKSLPRDHPLQALYDFAGSPEQEPAPTPSPSPVSVSGTFDLNVKDSAAKQIVKVEATIAAPAAETRDACTVKLPPLSKPFSFLITTIPDPERTHLGLMFDRHLEAVRLAAADAGYSFDRYWLPWRNEEQPDSPDPDIRKKNEEEKVEREKQPGLLLFRSGDGSTPDLVVFLVGETPTSGVDVHQFLLAACYSDRLAEMAPGTPDFKGILGPMFSGSFPSLDLAIEESYPKASLKEPILSGTTTNGKAIKEFQDHRNFHTTSHDDDDSYCALVEQFRWTRVAVLSEDGTGYGRDAPICPEIHPDSTLIYYPREISRLRNAYQDDPALAAAQKNLDPAARNQLSLSLSDSQNGRDTVPQFSAEQTPATQETALFQIADTLQRGRFPAVIVRGTNILDTLFLSRYLHQCCADLRVAVLDADLLFVHGTDSLDYLGILTVGSYPLSPVTRLPEPNAPGQHIFSSNDEEGAYYAALLLLEAPDPPLLVDYAGQFSDGTSPPVRISTVGRGTYWPVTVDHTQKGTDLKRVPRQAPQPSDFGYPSRVWDTIFYASGALMLLYAGVYFYAVDFSKPLKRWCSDFHPRPDGEASNCARAVCHLWISLSLLAAWCALAFAPLHLLLGEGQMKWRLSALCAIVVSEALLGVIVDTCRRFVPNAIWVGWVAIVIVILGVIWSTRPDQFRLFQSLRSVDLASGVAPSLPLIMLFSVLAYCAWIYMQRFIFIDERNPDVPALTSLPTEEVEGIKAFVNERNPLAGRKAVCAIIASACSTIPAWYWFGSIESTPFKWAFLSLLFFCAALLGGTAWQFVELWHRFRSLLQTLELHPIRQAFSDLPPMSRWSPLWQTSAKKKSYAIRERAAESLHMLCSLAPVSYQDLAHDMHRVEGQVTCWRSLVRNGWRESPAHAAAANSLGNEIACKLEPMLDSWRPGSSETIEKIKETHPKRVPGKKDQPGLLAAEFIALRHVAFIRYVMLHLKNKLSFLTGGFVLIAIALNSYPFAGADYFRWWLTGVSLILGTIVVLVFVEMQRDPTLNRLMDTKAGEVNGDFYTKLISAGVLPLLAVVSALFPSIGRFLFSWLQPALSSLH